MPQAFSIFDIIASDFRRGVAVADRKYLLKTYENCFVGSEAVDYLVKSGAATSRADAVTIGQSLMKYQNLFEHVTRDHEFEDKGLFYRFIPENKSAPKRKLSVDDLVARFRNGLDIQDRTYRLKTYKQCFVGSEAIDFLIESGAATNRVEGLKLGQALMKHPKSAFAHVAAEHAFEDEQFFYRFVDCENNASNSS